MQPNQSTTETEAGRTAALVGTGDLVRLLERTNGWRTRQAISNLLREMEECAGAARFCEEHKDWTEMLRHLSDGLQAAKKLQEITQPNAEVMASPPEKTL